MDEEELIQRFAERGVNRGAEWFFSPSVCLELVDECERNSLAVVGIEGFKIVDSKVFPKVDLITDWSEIEATNWAAFVAETSALSRKFIKTEVPTEDGLFLNLTILSQSDLV